MASSILLALLAASICCIVGAQNATLSLSGIVSGPQGPLQRIMSAYANSNALPDAVNITVATRFSGPAQDLFLSGGADFVSADIPIEPRRLALAGRPLTQFPLFAGAVSFHHSLPNFTGPALRLDACTLASIYSGAITSWNHPEIRRRNPHLTYGGPIVVVARNDASNFTTLATQYFKKGCPSRWSLPVNQTMAWPASVMAVAGGALVGSLLNHTGAIVYLDLTAALPASLANSSVAIQTAQGRTWVTARSGGFDSAGFSAEGALAAGNVSWADVSLVWETLHNSTKVPAAAASQYPIAFLTFFAANADLRPMGSRGVLLREYAGFLLGPYVQSRLAANGWRPLPPAFRAAALSGAIGLHVAQPVSLPYTWN